MQDVDAALSMARVVGKQSSINRLSKLRTNIYNENDKALVIISSTPYEGKSKFSRDTLVVRYLAGVDIPFSQNLAVKLQASKQTTMEKSIEFNLGASLLF